MVIVVLSPSFRLTAVTRDGAVARGASITHVVGVAAAHIAHVSQSVIPGAGAVVTITDAVVASTRAVVIACAVATRLDVVVTGVTIT